MDNFSHIICWFYWQVQLYSEGRINWVIVNPQKENSTQWVGFSLCEWTIANDEEDVDKRQ